MGLTDAGGMGIGVRYIKGLASFILEHDAYIATDILNSASVGSICV